MPILQRSPRWFYAVAGSGVVLGLFGYFQRERQCVKTAWTNNFEPSVKWDNNWDGRHYSTSGVSDKIAKDSKMHTGANDKKPTARRHIFLVRHGQYNMSPKFDSDRCLTEIGQTQADLVGKRLKELNFTYSRIVRSTMLRARQTADAVSRHLPEVPVQDCDLIREGEPVRPEPVPDNWSDNEEETSRDGSRIEAAFRKYFHRADLSQTKDSFEILVCHANVIRYFLCRLLQFPPEAWLRFQLLHCSVTWVVIVPSGRVGVYMVGDSGFLSHELMTA